MASQNASLDSLNDYLQTLKVPIRTQKTPNRTAKHAQNDRTLFNSISKSPPMLGENLHGHLLQCVTCYHHHIVVLLPGL
jgi:hypothetical protein